MEYDTSNMEASRGSPNASPQAAPSVAPAQPQWSRIDSLRCGACKTQVPMPNPDATFFDEANQAAWGEHAAGCEKWQAAERAQKKREVIYASERTERANRYALEEALATARKSNDRVLVRALERLLARSVARHVKAEAKAERTRRGG